MIEKALLAKIRKCLALSSSCNEHEAAAALAKARALMDEHGITDVMLEMAEVEEATARASRTMRPPRWESILGQAVCRALGVVQFINAVGDRTFVGRGPGAEIASYAFAALSRRLKAARADYVKTVLRRCGPGRKRARADAFCEGWVLAVHAKIRALAPEQREDEAVAQYLVERYPGLQTVNSRGASSKRTENDRWRGFDRGSDENLHRGVHGSAAPLALA